MTAQDVIYGALRRIGNINRPGGTASPELMADALTEWQAFADNWNTDQTFKISNPGVDTYSEVNQW